jgi:hypothetical protein
MWVAWMGGAAGSDPARSAEACRGEAPDRMRNRLGTKMMGVRARLGAPVCMCSGGVAGVCPSVSPAHDDHNVYTGRKAEQ